MGSPHEETVLKVAELERLRTALGGNFVKHAWHFFSNFLLASLPFKLAYDIFTSYLNSSANTSISAVQGETVKTV